MNTSSKRSVLGRMPEVEHLVIHHIFDGEARNVGAVEDSADDDGVVRGIVVAEQCAGWLAAPTESRASHESEEVGEVQFVENREQVVVLAGGTVNQFAASDAADLIEFLPHLAAVEVAAIAEVALARHRTAEEFRKQDLRQGFLDIERRASQRIGELHGEDAGVELNLGSGAGVASELNVDLG